MGKKLRLKEAAKEIGVSEYFLRTEIKAGKLPFIMTGNRYLLDLDQINEYLSIKAIENMSLLSNN